MRSLEKITSIKFLFIIFILFANCFLSLKTLKRVNARDIKIYGSDLFSNKDIIRNSSLNFSTRLIFIQTNYIEKELKESLSLENVSVTRQILPFGLKVLIKTRTPIAYGEKMLNGKKISGFIDKDGFFINKKHTEKENLQNLKTTVFGWHENSKKTLSKILTAQKNNDFELVKVSFSPNGFLTLQERNLKTILLGFNPNLIPSQLQIISNLKEQLNKNNFFEKIDKIDLTDPNNPKIKVFKP